MQTICCRFRTRRVSPQCEYAGGGSDLTPARRPSRIRRARTGRASFYRGLVHASKAMNTV